MHPFRTLLATALLSTVLVQSGRAQVPTPESVFGFKPGTDYKLADYDQIVTYFRELDAASDRVIMTEIGKSVEGRPLVLLTISSEENLKDLDRYKAIARRMAMAGDLSDDEARVLSHEGKAVVWFNVGIDPEEVAAPQHSVPLAYHLVASEDAEVRNIRDRVIILLMPVMMPDGQDRAVSWYRMNLGTPFEIAPRPEPFIRHPYIGGDTNRDVLFIHMPETKAVTYQLWHEWFPQIVHDHHQTGPFPGRIFVPPFTDPVNPHIHPLVVRGVNFVGAALAKRFAEEGKPGVSSHVQYSMWWNGGMRLTPYYHNQIGILTETAQHDETATPHYYDPDSLPERLGPRRGATVSAKAPSIFYPDPWKGGWWRVGDAMDYMLTASLATADIAARHKEEWLYNIYLMGKDAIAKGRAGNPYAYVISPDQWDPGVAVDMVNLLRRAGVEVHRATSTFVAGDRECPAGTYIAFAAQPFRPHLMDLMEPQAYPDRRMYPGGPPDRPYDLAGWTVPIQMGVTMVRIEDPFEVAADRVDIAPPPSGAVSGERDGFGYLLSHRSNAAVLAVNRLLEAGDRVSWTGEEIRVNGTDYEPGTIVIEARGRRTTERLESLAEDLGLQAIGLARRPAADLHRLSLPRVGVYKSMVIHTDQGWTRWLLEQYEFPFEALRNEDVRGRDLSRFDAIVLPNYSPDVLLNGHLPGTLPSEYVGGLGAEGAAALARFVEGGGTLVALAQSCDFAIHQLGLPVRNSVAAVREEQFFIPASLVRVQVDARSPVAYGMPREAAASYTNTRGHRSMAFDLIEPARQGEQVASIPRVEVVARYADEDILLSGWEIGAQRYLAGKPAVVSVEHGDGEVVLIGFAPQFRAQPAGTFKLLFNPLHASTLAERP
jgi:glutamine amidotransferase-like uncharacterized protein